MQSDLPRKHDLQSHQRADATKFDRTKRLAAKSSGRTARLPGVDSEYRIAPYPPAAPWLARAARLPRTTWAKLRCVVQSRHRPHKIVNDGFPNSGPGIPCVAEIRRGPTPPAFHPGRPERRVWGRFRPFAAP